jgi:hypothetical protein
LNNPFTEKLMQKDLEIQLLKEEIKKKEKVSDYNADMRIKYEKALKRIIKQTSCDDTWDFANRVLEGKPNNDLFYRINID